jgi:hypothetical protein
MASLSARDGARWHHVADVVAGIVEPKLSASVLANRAAAPSSWWRPRPLGPSLAAARRRAYRLPGPVILRTDVAAFYPSIRPTALFEALRGLDVPADVAGSAADLVDGWGSEGYDGLPIGPPGSAVMANAVLASVDVALDPHPFLRWVDDYLISVPSIGAADEALERLEDALARAGLRLSPPKTALLEAGPPMRWLRASGG